MWKRVNCLIVIALVSSVLMSDCSASNELVVDTDWKPSQEVIVINGHTLPPELSPAINNSTLLGVDSNGNGVRDDVEIWIYKKYKDKHPIHIDIAMQAGRAWQKVLEDPMKAKDIHPIVDAPTYCEGYYKINAKYFNESILINEDINTKYFRRKILFNTKERLKAFWQFDKLLSGNSYTLPKIGAGKLFCDFNTSKYESNND